MIVQNEKRIIDSKLQSENRYRNNRDTNVRKRKEKKKISENNYILYIHRACAVASLVMRHTTKYHDYLYQCL